MPHPMPVPTLMIAALASLSACNSGPSVSATNASTSEVAAKVEAAGIGAKFVSPGQWQTTMTIRDLTMPDMPPQVAAQMKAHMGQGKTFLSCLTPEEAKKPREDFFAKGSGKCRYDHFTMGGGKIDAALKCAEGPSMRTMTMTGTYSPESYQMTMTSQGSGDAGTPGAGMSMTMNLDAKRTGECTGKELG